MRLIAIALIILGLVVTGTACGPGKEEDPFNRQKIHEGLQNEGTQQEEQAAPTGTETGTAGEESGESTEETGEKTDDGT